MYSIINRDGLKKLKKLHETKALLKEKTLSLVNAIPKDIKIKKIVAYVSNEVVFSTKFGSLILKYKRITEIIIA